MALNPTLLRRRAERCRRLAAGIMDKGFSQRLLALAQELDKEATAVEPEDIVVPAPRPR
jgi:hypothetical protein